MAEKLFPKGRSGMCMWSGGDTLWKQGKGGLLLPRGPKRGGLPRTWKLGTSGSAVHESFFCYVLVFSSRFSTVGKRVLSECIVKKNADANIPPATANEATASAYNSHTHLRPQPHRRNRHIRRTHLPRPQTRLIDTLSS